MPFDETPLPPIAILGAGSMGGAILHGLVRSGLAAEVTATNRTAAKAAELASLPGVTSIALEQHPRGNAEAAASADIVLIGVKPAMVPDLLREIAPHLRPGAIVVSLAAGVTTHTFESILGTGVAVLRSMPNTPALVGKAVTGLAAGSRSGPCPGRARSPAVRDRRQRGRGPRIADRRAVDDLGLRAGLRLPPRSRR